jgi:hypothetical protein
MEKQIREYRDYLVQKCNVAYDNYIEAKENEDMFLMNAFNAEFRTYSSAVIEYDFNFRNVFYYV